MSLGYDDYDTLLKNVKHILPADLQDKPEELELNHMNGWKKDFSDQFQNMRVQIDGKDFAKAPGDYNVSSTLEKVYVNDWLTEKEFGSGSRIKLLWDGGKYASLSHVDVVYLLEENTQYLVGSSRPENDPS